MATGRREARDRQTTGKRQESDRLPRPATGRRQGGDSEATGRRQGGGRKTTGKRQEGNREATGNSDRRATGRNDRRATGERQEGVRQKVAWRQETTGSNSKQQDSDRRAAEKRQRSDREATGERSESEREATGKRQGSDRGPKVPKKRQGGNSGVTGWRQEREAARIYWWKSWAMQPPAPVQPTWCTTETNQIPTYAVVCYVFPQEPTWCFALPPATHAPRSWAHPHLPPSLSGTRGAHHRGQIHWQERRDTPLLLLVVATCGNPQMVHGATRTPLYEAASVHRPPPPGARGTGLGTHLPADRGCHHHQAGVPCAAPPGLPGQPLRT